MQLTQTNQNALFSLSNDQWIDLNKFIGALVGIQYWGPIHCLSSPSMFLPAPHPNPIIPSFSSCCKKWTTSTFFNINQVASNVLTYSTNAINSFSPIQSAFSKLGSADPIPVQLQQQTKAAIAELCTSTQALYLLITPVLNDVLSIQSSLTDINKELNCDNLNKFIDFFQLFHGAWQALESDLVNVTSSPITVTNAFLASLDLNNSINLWTSLQDEVSGFSVIMTETKALWSAEGI